MSHISRFAGLVIVTIGLVCVGNLVAFAQSGSRSNPPNRSGRRTSPSTGSSVRTTQQVPLVLEGRCPVSIVEMRKWVKGDPAHQIVYDGQTYRFAGEQGQQMFQANPAKYLPDEKTKKLVASGDFAVSYLKYDWSLNEQ